jgi:hypothetical protein
LTRIAANISSVVMVVDELLKQWWWGSRNRTGSDTICHHTKTTRTHRSLYSSFIRPSPDAVGPVYVLHSGPVTLVFRFLGLFVFMGSLVLACTMIKQRSTVGARWC